MKKLVKKRRLFLAIPLDEKTLAIIKEFKDKYSEHENIKWVKQKNLHITMLFLENVEDQKLPMLFEIVDRVLQKQTVLELKT